MMIGKQNFLGKGGDPVSSGFRPPSRQQGGRGLLSSPPQMTRQPLPQQGFTPARGPDTAGNMNQAMPNAQFGDAGMQPQQPQQMQPMAQAMPQPMPQKSGGFMIGNQPQGGYNPPQAAPRQAPSAMPMRRR